MKGISLSAIVGARTKSALTRVGSLGLALCLASTPTYATDASIGANSGYAFDRPDCFRKDGSSIVNVCPVRSVWIIPVFTPATGHHYRVTVRASPNGGPNITTDTTLCNVFSLDNENNIALFEHRLQSFTESTNNSLDFQDLVIPRIYVLGPDDSNGPGTLQVECVVAGLPPQTFGGHVLRVDLENLD